MLTPLVPAAEFLVFTFLVIARCARKPGIYTLEVASFVVTTVAPLQHKACALAYMCTAYSVLREPANCSSLHQDLDSDWDGRD